MNITAERLFARLCRIQALAVLVVVALMFPLALDQQAVFSWFVRWLPGEGLQKAFIQGFQSFLTASYTPLMLKEILTGMGIAMLLFFFVVWRALWPLQDKEERRRALMVLVLLALAIVSALWQSPTYYYSLITLTRVACLSVYACIVMSLARARYFMRKGAALIVWCAALLAAIALLQHLGLVEGIIAHYEHHRNRIGSLIGHNTGLSVYLMFGLFIALSWLYGPLRSATHRTLIACLAGVMAFVLLLAQSRSVWIILVALLPCFLVVMRRWTGVGPRLRHWLAVGALALILGATQLIDSPLNVLGVRQYSFSRRLQDFEPSQLVTETRLRILVCSLPLILKSPWIGSGLGSFQYVYPEAQMRYYEAHPFMWIAPTSARSQHGHDDYLQLLIETGVIGCLLVFWLVGRQLRQGWREQRRALEIAGRQEAARLGVFFAIAGFASQAALDFPMHIIPLSLTGFFLLAVWAGSPAPAAAEEQTEAEALPAASGAKGAFSAGKARSRSAVRYRQSQAAQPAAAAVAGLVCGAALAVTTAGFIFFGREALSDYFRNVSTRNYTWIVKNYRQMTARKIMEVLNSADQASSYTCRIAPTLMEARNEHAEVLQLIGEVLMKQSEGAERLKDAKRAGELKAEAIRNLKKAVEQGEVALAEFRNHAVFADLGGAYHKLYDLTREESHQTSAIAYLELAARYSPAYAEPINELVELYDKENKKPTRVMELRAMLARYNPAFYAEQYTSKLFDSMYNEMYADAVDKSKALLETARFNADHDPRFKADARQMSRFYVASLIALGSFSTAEKELENGEKTYPHPYEWRQTRVHLLLAKQEWGGAAQLVRGFLPELPEQANKEYWEIVDVCLARKLRETNADARWNELLIKARQNLNYYLYLGKLSYETFDWPDRALEFLTKRSKLKPEPPAQIWGWLAILEYNRGATAQGLAYLDKALPKNPKNQRLKQLRDKLQPK
ncbi:MAG: O-antigen ligase family protein [Candidatus Sumerlaeota bacterium]|nr:O-antigen ligase family protein [Candidatus Sumerlaeota bacterium]